MQLFGSSLRWSTHAYQLAGSAIFDRSHKGTGEETVSTEREIETYLAEAASWDADSVAQARRSSRIAWGVAGAGWMAALAAVIAVMLLTPLKRVEPFVIRVDDSSGVVDVVPVYNGTAEMSETVTRYLLTHYVTVCERFNFSTAEVDYEECGAFHSAQRNQAWYAAWNPSNPQSPLNVNKDGTTVRAQVKSVSFFKRANGLSDLAQVRYLKTKRTADSAKEQVTHWIASIQYVFTEPSRDPKTRGWNPLGFKVVDFKPEAEMVQETVQETAELAVSSSMGTSP
jgi:type IV secretion system protein VirB8